MVGMPAIENKKSDESKNEESRKRNEIEGRNDRDVMPRKDEKNENHASDEHFEKRLRGRKRKDELRKKKKAI